MDLVLYNSNFFIRESEIFPPNNDIFITSWTPSTGSSENNNVFFYPVDTSLFERYKQEEFTKAYIKHYRTFLSKLEEQSSYFKGIDIPSVTSAIKEVLGYIIPLEPSFLSFDLTEDRSVFFKAVLNDYNIYLELFFISETSGLEAVLNIYKDKTNIYAFGGEIFECFKKIKKNIFSNSIYPCENELSESFITS